jgi:putative Mn2+ efflux pump MntP
MDTPALFLLAIGLCFDTFAVSLSGGVGVPLSARRITKITLVFTLVHTSLLMAGWCLGVSLAQYITAFDHWIAFALLAFIGGKMIRESFRPGAPSTPLGNPYVLLIVAFATSIDAIAVGVSLACVALPFCGLLLGSAMVFAVTAVAVVVGLLSGHRLGTRIGKRAECFGGLILIALGTRILIEHLRL